MLYSDKFGFMLLPCLVIDLKSVIKLKSHDTPKRHAPFLTGHYTIVLIAGPIFCIAFWTLADHVHACMHAPLLGHMYDPQGKNMLLHKIVTLSRWRWKTLESSTKNYIGEEMLPI